jgi:integrase
MMPDVRREWGSGAIVKITTKRGLVRYLARIEDPDSPPGKRRQLTRTCKTRVEAKRALAELRSSSSQETAETVGDFLARWLHDGVGSSVRERTRVGYQTIVRSALIPVLGATPVSLLRPDDIRRLLQVALRRGLAPRTVSHQLACLRTALQWGVAEGILERNVAALVRGPHVPHVEVRPLSDQQATALLDHVAGTRLEALFVLALRTGMRQGELLGLRWEDVDLEHGEIHVRKALVVGGRFLDDVKTKRSRRTIPIGPSTVAALRDHQRRQGAERVDNPDRVEQGFVFAGPLGSPLDASAVTRTLQRHLADAGLPRQRFHDLRHAAASLMLARGASMREIADMLGHSTPSLTANVYSHLGDGALRAVATRQEQAVG